MKHAISAGHELTLNVAKQILQAGGNAFDAATAAFFAMFITEPCMASAGGNGFAILKPHSKIAEYIDFFSQTPRTKDILKPHFYPITVNFGNTTEEFHIGLASAAVPGSIAGILEIHKRHGSLPLIELIQPARQLAIEGVVLNEFQAYDISLLASILGEEETGQRIFFENGEVKKKGDLLHMPDMANFLDFIAQEGTRGFYEGEIAASIVSDQVERGGFLRMEDFSEYEVHVSKPLGINFGNHKAFLPNAPNRGGISLAAFLGFNKIEDNAHAEAIRLTQELTEDPVAVMQKMNTWYPGHNFQSIPNTLAPGGTSHFNILDKQGNAISLTSSIGEGSGYFIPGTAMQLNNMLGELYLLPGGQHSWKPDQRLGSMMTPTLILDHKETPVFLGGSGGASRIPFAIGQVILNHFDNKLNLQDAVEKSRYHFQNGQYQVEGGATCEKGYKNILHWDRKSLYFGGVHAISNLNQELEAVGDSRRFGVAEIFD
jgi:gamma-glutamyltranspeptidase/glutathione hydrolase